MVAKRIIPCLDVKNGRTVKGTNFVDLKDMGDPVELATLYARSGADEVVFLDIGASVDNQTTLLEMVSRCAAVLPIPFTVGGGIRSLDDAHRVLDRGADKIALNSAALANPSLVSEIASVFGSQAVVLAIDYKREGERAVVFSHGGTKRTDREALSWAIDGAALGAGELLVTSMDRDGTGLGFDLEVLRTIDAAVSVPVVASGGAGRLADFVELFVGGGADAALAAGIFHRGEVTVGDVKNELTRHGVTVRL